MCPCAEGALRREIYLRLEKALSEKGPVLTAERVYRALFGDGASGPPPGHAEGGILCGQP